MLLDDDPVGVVL
jgi:hypothetical protein